MSRVTSGGQISAHDKASRPSASDVACVCGAGKIPQAARRPAGRRADALSGECHGTLFGIVPETKKKINRRNVAGCTFKENLFNYSFLLLHLTSRSVTDCMASSGNMNDEW